MAQRGIFFMLTLQYFWKNIPLGYIRDVKDVKKVYSSVRLYGIIHVGSFALKKYDKYIVKKYVHLVPVKNRGDSLCSW